MPSHFLLDEKVTKESRLPNLCSFHHGKSLERNPSRGNGGGLSKFLQHFCGLLMSVGQQRKCRKIYRAPIQTFRGRFAEWLCYFKSAHIVHADDRKHLTSRRCWFCCLLPHHKERWKCREIRKSVAVNRR